MVPYHCIFCSLLQIQTYSLSALISMHNNVLCVLYNNSLKPNCGEIIFQGPVWCGDNSGQLDIKGGICRGQQRCGCDNQHCSPCVHMNIACAHTHIAVDPLQCSKISRVEFIGMIYMPESTCGDLLWVAIIQGAVRF